jgi:hypothetical protein
MRFAPPPKRLDNQRLAVPIDIETISAKLIFNAAKQQVHGDAAIRFRHGVEHGYPLFDLRQPVEGVWLDGARLSAGEAAVPFRRLGARREQSMRVLQRKLRAGDRHRLRLTYRLHTPPLHASSMGGYQPRLTWPDNRCVDFNFGFTDLGGGRYLEAWVPANLIYDRFTLTLEVIVRHTARPHVVVTNGESEEVSLNHWRVRFPSTFTALSPMLQLHPRDAVESTSRSVKLPASKRSVEIEAWKFCDNPIDLDAQAAAIGRWLARNDRNIGPYHHGNRYVAFMHVGGMEYDGGCTAAPVALEHEVFHSWWARGLKPASQNDGWIDEAWAVYHDDGGAGERAFDFTEPPVRLCSGTPWNRSTPIASYRLGSRFFAGIAARLGHARLHAIMNQFYSLHAPGLIATSQLEAHILDRTNDEVILRAFDRWVYGRAQAWR